jgi:5'-nucleotidase
VGNDGFDRPWDDVMSQLPLPLASAPETVAQIPRAQRVFVNRNLRLDQINWVGFDMDYTLAIYRQEEMDRLSIEATVKKMVERGRPESLLSLSFEPGFSIRGLHVDKKLGNILKMDRYRYVKRAYHGMKRLSRDERRALYASRPIRPGTKRFHWVDTLYALPEVTLYAAAVEHLEPLAIAEGTPLDYGALFDQVRECIDLAHQDGSIVDVIANDPERYLVRDPLLGPALHKLRSAGKRLFLLTNSRAGYTKKILSYLLDGALPAYARWQSYFDVIVCAAKKPRFFTDPSLPILPGEPDLAVPTERLEDGRIYEGGCLTELEKFLAAETGGTIGGDEILYVGDHIYGDVLRAKKESAWRTMMVVQEMAPELHVYESMATELARMDELHDLGEGLLDELRRHQAQLKTVDKAIDEAGRTTPSLGSLRVTHRKAIERIKARLQTLESEREGLEARIDGAFHPYWGSLFSTGEEITSFGDQVEQYACLYSERVSNLLQYSAAHYFRGPRDSMPHEL